MIKAKQKDYLNGSTAQRVLANELLLGGTLFETLSRTTLSKSTFEDTGYNIVFGGQNLRTDRTHLNDGTINSITIKSSDDIAAFLTGFDMAVTALQASITKVLSVEGGITELLDDSFDSFDYRVFGNNKKNVCEGGDGDDFLNAKGGKDLIIATLGNDTCYGGAGKDTITYEDINSAVKADLKAGEVNFSGDIQTILGFEVFAATSFSDHISGSNGGDEIFGLAGGDEILGRGGHDKLYGEDGQDHIYGGGGNDSIFGGNHNDLLFDEAGDDVVKGNKGRDKIVAGEGNDTFTGGPGSDRFIFDTQIEFLDSEEPPIVIDLGADTITDFGWRDRLRLEDVGTEDVSLMQIGDDTRVTFRKNTVDLLNVNVEDLVLTSPIGINTLDYEIF